jgi:DNA mismatch endonuclease (patch repair protein)
MADTLTPAQRSERMSRIRGRDTKPEMVVRRLIHRMGYRYRLHDRRLPGTPDLVFPARRKVIFVHGCFWHRHDCKLGRIPKSNLDFWLPKLEENRIRDESNQRHLSAAGWQHLVLWECQVRDLDALESRIRQFLGEPRACNRSNYSQEQGDSDSA